mmetsp:Transcript_5884/g.7152  ORF Transcript_5884/g.7152 Transcript_5884/m.7152 type:complete len:1359 (-) Transcript_5884:1928-6004(-)
MNNGDDTRKSTKIDENLYPEEIDIQKRLFTFLFSKKIPPLPSYDERKLYPEHNANCISRIFFWWLNPIMSVGYKRTLQPQDLFVLTKDMTVEEMTGKFTSQYQAKCEKFLKINLDKENHKETELPPKYLCPEILLLVFWKPFLLSCIFMTLSGIGSTLNPLLFRKLINFVEKKTNGDENSTGKGIGYALGTTGILFVCGLLQNHSIQMAMIVGAKCKAILTKAIIDKSFRLSLKSKHVYPSGKITSMMGADLARIDLAIGYIPVLISFPVTVIIAIVILIINIGVSALVGIALLVIFMVLLTFCTSKLIKIRRYANKYTDKRIRYIQEVLNNLRMIKFYSWELPYFDRIAGIRRLEMKAIFKMQALTNIVTAMAMSFTTVSSMVAFLVLYALRKNNRSPASIFSSLSLFNVLAQQVYVLPLVLSTCADAYVACTRVHEYLCCEERTTSELSCYLDESRKIEMDEMNAAIIMKNASFNWKSFDKNDKEIIYTQSLDDYSIEDKVDDERKIFNGLKDINLCIYKNEFIVITGLIGSGKTSFLSALSGFMNRSSGSAEINGSLLFCSQPWIQNSTLRENILFGSEFQEDRYEEVIDACSLSTDLKILSAGDKTEIGERGITLSGGQKARVNLARAVYADRDIILMDDVLSAVDAKVGINIMNKCILGLLKNKTRILATHQLSLIGSADRIIFLNGDGTYQIGTFKELQLTNKRFVELMTHNSFNDNKDIEKEGNDRDSDFVKLASKDNSLKVSEGKLIGKEGRAVNKLSLQIYKNYLKFGSGVLGTLGWCAIYFSNTIFATFSQLFSNVWLSFWIDHKFGKPSNFYIGLYIMFSMLSVIFLVIELLSLVYLINTASLKLSLMSTKNILHTTMSFLDTTPIGRVLNRFSRDTEILDNEIGNQLRITSYSLSTIIGVIILCIIYLPWFAISLPPLAVIFTFMISYYQESSREVKRLESVQRSFVYSIFGEILGGMDTLKIYQVEDIFNKRLSELIDKMNEAYFISITNQRWLGIHLTLIASIFALIITILCVQSVFNINASSVGLLLSYILQITTQLVQLMRSITRVENEMNSMERINDYAVNLVQEAPYQIIETTPEPEWPSKGEIRFENVSLRYREGLPSVLNNLTFKIQPNEKIGICGRTGAGKSSIMTCMFRLNELQQGKICIDDIDISSLGLHELRSKLSIIPQDPILFTGTIRRNLDPFNEADDKLLLDALIKVGLISMSQREIMTLNYEDESGSKFHLNHVVEEDGNNYSLGEKQLISFARALVRNTKILILDEATSSVDYETDAKIQATIAEDFKDCTILCIAHRLKTIIQYDRILVLDKGNIKEFDRPLALFKHRGIFREMCDKSNIIESDFSN